METVIKIGERHYTGKFMNEFASDCSLVDIPKSLNKYHSLSKYSIDAIMKRYIYVNHPLEFNDPYDSIYQFSHDSNTLDEFYEFNSMFLNLGLISMSESDNNMLMWAHYSNHDGFLINFNIKRLKDKFTFIMPMNYIKYLPDMKGYDNTFLRFIISTNIKHEIWQYEREWRLYYSESPMILPETSPILKKLNHEWLHKPKRKFKDRKAFYDVEDINYISLGYKFIYNEDHAQINSNTVNFNVTNLLKRKLLNYIIETQISTKIVSLGNIEEFAIEPRLVEIKKIKGDFEFQFKYIA